MLWSPRRGAAADMAMWFVVRLSGMLGWLSSMEWDGRGSRPGSSLPRVRAFLPMVCFVLLPRDAGPLLLQLNLPEASHAPSSRW